MSVGVSPTISEEEKFEFVIFVSPHIFICHYYQIVIFFHVPISLSYGISDGKKKRKFSLFG